MICSCTFSQFRRQPNCTLRTSHVFVHTQFGFREGKGVMVPLPGTVFTKLLILPPPNREQILTLNYLTHLGIFKPSPQNNPFSEALQGTWVRNLDSCVDAFGLEGYFPSHPQTHVVQ